MLITSKYYFFSSNIFTIFKIIFSFFKTFEKVKSCKNLRTNCRWAQLNLNQIELSSFKRQLNLNQFELSSLNINEVDWTWVRFITVHLRQSFWAHLRSVYSTRNLLRWTPLYLLNCVCSFEFFCEQYIYETCLCLYCESDQFSNSGKKLQRIPAWKTAHLDKFSAASWF